MEMSPRVVYGFSEELEKNQVCISQSQTKKPNNDLWSVVCHKSNLTMPLYYNPLQSP